MHFCLIDDDPHLLATLKRGLTELGHECETFQSSTAGLARMLDSAQPEPDVLLLDVMMPELNGWDVLAQMRESGRKTAVIYVTARRDVDDRVRGLMQGADDYVMKPYALRELLARADTVVRRRGFQDPYQIGELIVHRARTRVDFEGTNVDVSEREHAFLELPCSDPEHVFSRPELLRHLWQINFDPQTNVVEVLVARVRRKLGPVAARVIKTVVGQGYQLQTPEAE